jgi:hypothetical protein
VLDKAGDLLLGDWVEKSDSDHVGLEELLLSLEEEDDIELDVEHQESQIQAVIHCSQAQIST